MKRGHFVPQVSCCIIGTYGISYAVILKIRMFHSHLIFVSDRNLNIYKHKSGITLNKTN